jgi:hypothetical protein
MSEESKPKASQQPARDPLEELAEKIFVQLSARIYSTAGTEKPQPKAVAQLAFKLAEVFQASNVEFNPVARAAREAKEKAAVNVAAIEIDFAAIGKSK